MLTVQYRMNEGIMKWASDELYESKLTVLATVLRQVRPLPDVDDASVS